MTDLERALKHIKIGADAWAIKEVEKALSQEPCDDAVSRQAALNSLIDNTHLEGYDLAEALDAIENKEKLPPVTQKSKTGHWISVSERLPEAMDGTNGECSDDVLICVADDEQITISTGFYGYYPRSISQQGWWSMWAYGCHQLDRKYKVIAWMPLPKPYEPQERSEYEYRKKLSIL